MARALTLDLLADRYGVIRLAPGQEAPPPRAGTLRILIDDPRERTLICPVADLRPDLHGPSSDQIWRALIIADDTAFDEPGILVSITAPIAAAGIGLLGHSTFTADTLMVAEGDLDAAIAALRSAGHRVRMSADTPPV